MTMCVSAAMGAGGLPAVAPSSAFPGAPGLLTGSALPGHALPSRLLWQPCLLLGLLVNLQRCDC